MTADELRASVARSRAAQGLPPTVEDEAVLRQVSLLVADLDAPELAA